MKRLLTLITLALALTACGSDPEQPERPGSGRPPSVDPEAPVPPSPDDIPGEITSDPTTRFVSDALTMRYDDGGVIYSFSPDTGAYNLTNITTGATVNYRPGSASAAATLLVNGEPVTLSAVDTIATAPSDTLRLRLTAANGSRSWLILAPL